ncbi:Metallo-dependent phosphatase-like protein [Gongronella butleri]|nr:Metallo-dependent phosphatase-like protein [Gongronella butleri]
MKVTFALCLAGFMASMVQAVPIALKTRDSSSLTGKFLHITDIHLDTYYLAGTDPSKLCHRKSSKKSKNTAGQYGALNTDCDSPVSLVEASFDFLKNKVPDVDFIIYTGDTARHDRDNALPRTSDDVFNDHKAVLKYFQDTYDVSKIKLVPTIGNNDMVDHDILKTDDSTYSKLETIWEPLGLNLTGDWKTGGYFVQNVAPGLRIVNTNSMFFFTKNDQVDDCTSGTPGQAQLDWLTQELTQARADKVQVYLIGHVPPNDDDDSKLYKDQCHSQYIDILGTFGDVISGHFTGHTNNDMLTAIVPNAAGSGSYKHVQALAGKAPSSVTNAASLLFNAPSIIPVNNPAIRVYNYQTSTSDSKVPFGTILDWTQYYADLDKANAAGSLSYEVEYVASQLFGVNQYNDKGIDKVFQELNANSTTLDLYSKYVSVSR